MKPLALVSLLALGCSSAAKPAVAPPPPPLPTPTPAPAHPVTISIIGTNDLHGAIERLPIFAGFVANLRAARAADGGGVILVDGGDLFQGTLESNLGEGADVVRAYNALGYAASAVGNHEFDYGPIGPAVTVHGPSEDPRGALKARAAEAHFPLLVANILDSASHRRIDWPNMPASTIVDVAGVKVGVLGLSTESTPYTTMAANFVGLEMAKPALAALAEAKALRAAGAKVVIVAAHLGSKCKDLDHPDDLASCDQDGEVFPLVHALPPGLIDVIVAGHTHAGVAHAIDGVAVIESFSSGRAFGRVDLTLSPTGAVTAKVIARPHLLCPLDADGNPAPVATCQPGAYEGKPVIADPAIKQIADAALARAGARRAAHLGVTVAATITRAHETESALGNLMTDLMLAARPDAQVAMTNGGGLRADLPAGDLTYGQLFEANPFDNRFAMVHLKGAELRRLVTDNLTHGGAILSWSGLAAKARCQAGTLAVDVTVGGKPLADKATYTMATSDFLASGGDGVIGRLGLLEGAVQPTDVIIREAQAEVLTKRGGALVPGKLLDPAHPRLAFTGHRPVRCGEVTK